MGKFSEIRKVMRYYNSVEMIKAEAGDHYRLDRNNTREYFFLHKEWYKKIEKYVNEQKGSNLIHLDICGRTSARTMGFNESYCFALKTSELIKKFALKNHHFFNGSLFNPNKFKNFIKLIKDSGKFPSLVTFEPVAGLQDYGPKVLIEGVSNYRDIVFTYLSKRLCQVVEILKPGGFIYMERPFQFDSDDTAYFSGIFLKMN